MLCTRVGLQKELCYGIMALGSGAGGPGGCHWTHVRRFASLRFTRGNSRARLRLTRLFPLVYPLRQNFTANRALVTSFLAHNLP